MTRAQPESPGPAVANRSRSALFSYGFRPFFLAAGAFAVLAIAGWVWMYAMASFPLSAQPPQLWHGHEMLFGFAGAAIAGFLLTAVPSWTGARGFAGLPLVLLSLAWLAGRVAFAAGAHLPVGVLAACELIFLPGLALLIAPPLLRARNRNTPLLLVIAALWCADGVFMYAMSHANVFLASTSLRVTIDILLLLVTVIGGRIVPAFTANALRKRGVSVEVRSYPWVERIVIGAMILIVLVDIAAPWHPLSAALAALAAVAHAWRMSGWRSLWTLSEPIVWSLHAGYAFLPIGLALKAVSLTTGAIWATHWLHALTIGCAATMVLAVMTRASLGHTGRPLVVATSIAVAYVLVLMAALLRVFLPALGFVPYEWTIFAAGLAWVAAWSIYVAVYTPILTSPRADS